MRQLLQEVSYRGSLLDVPDDQTLRAHGTTAEKWIEAKKAEIDQNLGYRVYNGNQTPQAIPEDPAAVAHARTRRGEK